MLGMNARSGLGVPGVAEFGGKWEARKQILLHVAATLNLNSKR